jgi:hypothetical protein
VNERKVAEAICLPHMLEKKYLFGIVFCSASAHVAGADETALLKPLDAN